MNQAISDNGDQTGLKKLDLSISLFLSLYRGDKKIILPMEHALKHLPLTAIVI